MSGRITTTIVAASELARDLERREHGGAARAADEDALLAGDRPRHAERVAVGDAHVAVDDATGSNVVGQKSSPIPSVR